MTALAWPIDFSRTSTQLPEQATVAWVAIGEGVSVIYAVCWLQVISAWLKCFHAIVPLLDKAVLKTKILPVALAKGANDETSVRSRVVCCAMLGSMATCLTKVRLSSLAHHH